MREGCATLATVVITDKAASTPGTTYDSYKIFLYYLSVGFIGKKKYEHSSKKFIIYLVVKNYNHDPLTEIDS